MKKLIMLYTMCIFPVLCLAGENVRNYENELDQPFYEFITNKESQIDQHVFTVETYIGFACSESKHAGYSMIPMGVIFSQKLDDISLCGWRRGFTEFFYSIYYTELTDGLENWISGISVGPRYNFQRDNRAKFIPFIESGVGVAFLDSRPEYGGMGQDFNFNFHVAIGGKYKINDDLFVRLTLPYMHYSNAGLSEPEHKNHAIDSFGVNVGIGLYF